MIREGQSDVTLKYIAESPKRLAIGTFTEGMWTPTSRTAAGDYRHWLSDVFARKIMTINGELVQTQGLNIRRYSEYLLERVRGYRDIKVDIVRVGSGRLKKLTVDKGLLRETESVQGQIQALLKCDVGVLQP
jgi:phosphatidylinositol-binding clathrin assembly protein